MKTVVIAGATGFVGQELIKALTPHYRVIGLTRKAPKASASSQVEWRSCDLFSLADAEAALKGADYAIYLVHSMMPSARLTQARFQDMDLIVADNFARAAAKNSIQQLIYLGGLIPTGETLSPHLTSRLEVEETLRASGVPVTVLRAGMVIGAGGSSFLIMSRLVRRLPMMICPRWTLNLTSPIALSDVVRDLAFCLENPKTYDETFEVSSPDILSYRQMMSLTAKHLGLRRPLIPIRLLTPTLSRLWVTLITQAPKALVKPLIESLKVPMVAKDSRLDDWRGGERHLPFEQALDIALQDDRGQPKAPLPLAFRKRHSSHERTVRSVQRLPFLPDMTIDWIADEYLRWLPTQAPYIVHVAVDEEGHAAFYLRLFGRDLIKLISLYLNKDRSHEDLRVFEIDGGVLPRTLPRGKGGYLEFRRPLGQNCALGSIHEFQPRLPWLIYLLTQAQAHAQGMKSFAKHLAKHADPIKVNECATFYWV